MDHVEGPFNMESTPHPLPPNPCCFVNAKKGASLVGILQMLHGIAMIAYAVGFWSLSTYPGIHSAFETYWSFGQPMLSLFLGAILVPSMIGCPRLGCKLFVGLIWLLIQLAFMASAIYRIVSIRTDQDYSSLHQSPWLYIELALTGGVIALEVYEIAIILSYLSENIDAREFEAEKKEVAQLFFRQNPCSAEPMPITSFT